MTLYINNMKNMVFLRNTAAGGKSSMFGAVIVIPSREIIVIHCLGVESVSYFRTWGIDVSSDGLMVLAAL